MAIHEPLLSLFGIMPSFPSPGSVSFLFSVHSFGLFVPFVSFYSFRSFVLLFFLSSFHFLLCFWSVSSFPFRPVFSVFPVGRGVSLMY